MIFGRITLIRINCNAPYITNVLIYAYSPLAPPGVRKDYNNSSHHTQKGFKFHFSISKSAQNNMKKIYNYLIAYVIKCQVNLATSEDYDRLAVGGGRAP
jgi:hypothetical protein